MSGIGHNRGPSAAPGHGWRRHCWSRARAELMPRLPLEVVRRRIVRAAELGLDYSTYAGLRASTRRDVIAVLFSTNALRMHRAATPPPERLARLAAMRGCGRIALAQPRHEAADLAARFAPVLDGAAPAPGALAGWSETRAAILAASRPHPRDGVVLVGAAAWEREWAAAARLGGCLCDAAFFAAPGAGLPPAAALSATPAQAERR